MTLHQISAAVRAAKGDVLLCGPTSFGYIVRATIAGKPCRIITPTPSKSLKVLPLEPGTETHVVSDESSLQTWLTSLSNVNAGSLATTLPA